MILIILFVFSFIRGNSAVEHSVEDANTINENSTYTTLKESENPTLNISLSEIESINIYLNDDFTVVDDKELINEIYFILCEMKLKQIKLEERDGGQALLINMKDGSTIPYVFLGSEIRIQGNMYEVDEDNYYEIKKYY